MNEQIEAIRPRLNSIQQRALIVGVIGTAGIVAGAFMDSEQFYRSYLVGYLFWIGIPLGSFCLLMLHNLVGGPWGFTIRRLLEAGAKSLPLMAILFIPLLFGTHSLYEWTHADIVAKDEVLKNKEFYFNLNFFYARVAIYFLFWIGYSLLILRMVRRREKNGESPVSPGLQNLSGLGIVLFAITITLAVIDWAMSIEPHWSSTIYGLILIIGQALSTFCFSVIMVASMMGMAPKFAEKIRAVYFHDLGNFMLAFTLLWAYTSLSQLIIIWGANLPEETPWYAVRLYTSWKIVPIILFAFHFFAPFFLLLSRKIKRNPKFLMRVAMLLILMRLVDLIWFIEPAFNRTGFHVSWMDFVAPIGIGGIFIYWYIGRLKGADTMLPVNTPFLAQQAEHH
ncbi:MAG TPA: hypothetical protein VHI13_12515 [Candidatus Kapabacteria bacterium]|nr:hypothetical protein [Candidatus Kapabacteria bacterium]